MGPGSSGVDASSGVYDLNCAFQYILHNSKVLKDGRQSLNSGESYLHSENPVYYLSVWNHERTSKEE